MYVDELLAKNVNKKYVFGISSGERASVNGAKNLGLNGYGASDRELIKSVSTGANEKNRVISLQYRIRGDFPS